jgi:uncharacterized phiE125 gp8 family phage protein
VLCSNIHIVERAESSYVTVAEMKEWLKIPYDFEDGLLQSLIFAAERKVEDFIQASVVDTTLVAVIDVWPMDGVIKLANFTAYEITDIVYKNNSGQDTTLPTTGYQFSPFGYWPKVLILSEPALQSQGLEAIKIHFKAGPHANAQPLDDRIKRAVLGIVGHWFKYREDFYSGEKTPVQFTDLLLPVRKFSF